MASHRRLRYGISFAIVHLVAIAALIPFEVLYRTRRAGAVAFQIHYFIDAPVWDAPRLMSKVIASRLVTWMTLSVFPGPSASPALICLEIAVFGAVGGVLYFLVGFVTALIFERLTKD